LSDPGDHSFGFSQLRELLGDLRQVSCMHEEQTRSSGGGGGGRGGGGSSFKELLHGLAMRLKPPSWLEPHDGSASYLRYSPAPLIDGEVLGRSADGTPLERSSVAFVRFDGEPTFTGAPAAGRKAAEQCAAEAALAFLDQTALIYRAH